MPLLAAVEADDQPWVPTKTPPVYAPKFDGHYAEPSYRYRYGVNQPSKKLYFSKEEQRRDGRTAGSYSVLLPDSRVQTVTYTVEGDSGFQAKVTYSGQARYPAPEPPTLRPPPPYPYDDDDGKVVVKPLPGVVKAPPGYDDSVRHFVRALPGVVKKPPGYDDSVRHFIRALPGVVKKPPGDDDGVRHIVRALPGVVKKPPSDDDGYRTPYQSTPSLPKQIWREDVA